MKRSEINELLQDAKAFFRAHQFNLPPFAYWSPEQWAQAGTEAQGIREAKLGWDVTDFGSGKFAEQGLLLFTVRNGCESTAKRPYAEKIMITRVNQRVPFHFHWQKTEDIINRGNSGKLVLEFYNSTSDGKFANTPVSLSCDGVMRTIPAGGKVVLGAGESVTITPGIYHAFYAQEATALVGEVSCVNDDVTDNRFYEALPRYPKIAEDAAPIHLLCSEYPAAKAGKKS